MSEIKVLIAEDHKIVRAGLKMIIDSQIDMKVVGEADDGHQAIQMTRKLKPDVLVMDVSMPELNGLDAAAKLKRTVPDTKILTLTRHTDKAYIQELLQIGVSAYVLKQSPSVEMLRGIRIVAGGGNYLDPAVTRDIFNLVGRQSRQKDSGNEKLNERESEVLRLIALGYSNKEIAAQLDTSVKTIESQKAAATRKLNIKGRNEIVNYAILQGWMKEN
ncbi:MAG: DNA-binding response regulator [Acidobacteria bacterium]|jgi:two-component system response regulator NreC|nr:DNA-binding response regulator [Acidobacteriota bacterium]